MEDLDLIGVDYLWQVSNDSNNYYHTKINYKINKLFILSVFNYFCHEKMNFSMYSKIVFIVQPCSVV